MRDLNTDSQGLGASMTVIGNGTPDEAAAFFEGHLNGVVPLLTDPGLTSYKALQLKRSLYSVSQPRSYLEAFRISRRGFRSGKRQGDSLQQGGAFVITPDHEVPFSFFSRTPDEHADPADILAALRELEGKSWGWNG